MSAVAQPDPWHPRRVAMVEVQLRQRGLRDARVLAAMEKVPRHEFVAPGLRDQAYEDHPLPIGCGQTISQPYIVGAMLEALALLPEDVVLEIGTGCGYQTAVLAELCGQVYSMELFAELAAGARQVLERLGYDHVNVLVGDGTLGLPDRAPFDAIVVSAAAPHVPAPLFQQLKEGGRMIIPVGPELLQELQLVRKLGGKPEISHLDGCRFVPLVGKEGFAGEY
ncbi:MAG TPA: protein-L-isoaspartate(D-aspartate) O-methyltransferase [Terriglobales bacterium]|nr:protein-L-isoaspartate(D-aspartate) O-methyltransferase [Terriglobales bacterium]